MSRSIHTTRRTWGGLRRTQFSDPEEKARLLEEAVRALRRKRRIKDAVHEERHKPEPPGSSPEAIPIRVQKSVPHLHYPLGEEELRGLLARLPAAATEGISRIELSLAKEFLEESCEDPEETDRDPFTGRLSGEVFPGVYTGTVLGTYSPNSGRIDLHAYVYDAARVSRLPLPADAFAGYLRLHAMKTFIHEVAHHHDRLVRVGRGRWLADDPSLLEKYAERMEYEWTREMGLPWLEERFPDETRALMDWVEEFGGSRVPLAFFAGDPRITMPDALGRLICSTSVGFESFVREITRIDARQASPRTWLFFAWEVYHSGEYELCLQVLDRVILQAPELIEAQSCKAETLFHLERLDEAFELAGDLIGCDARNSDAWEVRADVLEARKEWEKLLELSLLWEAAVDPAYSNCIWLLTCRAVACCALDRITEMEHWIELRVAIIKIPNPTLIRQMVFQRAGKPLPGELPA